MVNHNIGSIFKVKIPIHFKNNKLILKTKNLIKRSLSTPLNQSDKIEKKISCLSRRASCNINNRNEVSPVKISSSTKINIFQCEPIKIYEGNNRTLTKQNILSSYFENNSQDDNDSLDQTKLLVYENSIFSTDINKILKDKNSNAIFKADNYPKHIFKERFVFEHLNSLSITSQSYREKGCRA